MATDETIAPSTTATPAPSPQAPPQPVPPPDVVRLRVDLDGRDYRQLRHLAIETASSVNEMTCEGVRLLLRWYAAQGLPADQLEGGSR